jgi:hypothetical protein
MRKWLRQQSKDFYAAGFDALIKRMDKCFSVEDVSINKCFFSSQVRILHVLSFMSIFDLFVDSPLYKLSLLITAKSNFTSTLEMEAT